MPTQAKNQAARQFYYREIAPEEQGADYHTLNLEHQFWKGSKLRLQLGDEKIDDYENRLKNWSPQFSNDLLLDALMQELIEINSGAIKDYLQTIFIAKRRDKYANATAYWKSEESDGNVVLFNVGLSDAAYQYSILFDHFARLKTKILEKDYGACARFRTFVLRIISAHERWDQAGNFIQLTLEDMLDHEHVDPNGRASDVAALTDRFILCHEIAHHMLGHTAVDDRRFGNLHSATVFKPDKWPSVEKTRQDELEADLTAIGLMLGTPGQDIRNTEVDTVLGTLLTMTLFGQFAKDINVAYGEHPSMLMRYLNIVECLSNIPCEYFFSILRDISDFQKVLYREHKRGLKQSHSELTKILGSRII